MDEETQVRYSPPYIIINADANHNIVVAASEGIQDATSTPPAVPAAEKKEIVESAAGAHATGQDAGAAAAAGAPKVKTEKECM